MSDIFKRECYILEKSKTQRAKETHHDHLTLEILRPSRNIQQFIQQVRNSSIQLTRISRANAYKPDECSSEINLKIGKR